MESPRTAQIVDLAAHRLKHQSARRKRAGERRQFLWTWPTTGQILAVEFPFSTAKSASSIARA